MEIICPTVLSCSNLKLHQTLEVRNIFKREKIMLQLTFNPGLMLTGFPTTRPCFPIIGLSLLKYTTTMVPRGSFVLSANEVKKPS